MEWLSSFWHIKPSDSFAFSLSFHPVFCGLSPSIPIHPLAVKHGQNAGFYMPWMFLASCFRGCVCRIVGVSSITGTFMSQGLVFIQIN